MKQKQIVIVGGGFGGIAVAKSLAGAGEHYDITVIDQNNHHVIHGNLYEVASSPEELNNLIDLYHSVTLSYEQIFFGTKINFIQARVQEIKSENREIIFNGGSLHYDYLVIALGSRPKFYHIEGADKYAIPLQSATDALKIRNQVEFAVETKKLHGKGDKVRVIVAGGGVAGIELAAQLQTMFDFIAWKNNFPRHNIETVIIEGASTLLPGFAPKVSNVASDRLRDLGVEIQTHQLITRVDEQFVELKSGDKYNYDCLVWAAGVEANPLPLTPPIPAGRNNRIDVDANFRPASYDNVFIIGDQCCFLDSKQVPLPGTASQAIYQGGYVAQAIQLVSNGQSLPAHRCKVFPFAIPLGPKWTIFTNGRYLFKGVVGDFIRELVWLKYYISLLGLFKGWDFYHYTRRIFDKDVA